MIKMHTSPFSAHPVEARQNVSRKLRGKYPDRVPIIIRTNPNGKQIQLDTFKFLTPKDITLARFLFELRSHVKSLSPHAAIYLLLEDGTLPPISSLLSSLDDKHKNVDGFLYFICCEENTFGYEK